MDTKMALTLLIIQTASSSSRFHQETSDEVSYEDKSQDPRITDLLSILNDNSAGDDQTKLVQILPFSPVERYPKREKLWSKRKRLLKNSKQPLAIILKTSDLKRNKYSRRLLEGLDLVKEPTKGERKDLFKEISKENVSKEVKKENVSNKLSNEILLKELSTEDLSKALIKEYLSSEPKEDLTKVLSKEDILSKQLSDSSKELSSKEFSQDMSKELSKENYSKKESVEITMEEGRRAVSMENPTKRSETEASFEEINTILVSKEENIRKEKPHNIESYRHNEEETEKISSKENQTHETVNQYSRKNSDSLSTASDSSIETSQEKDASSESKEKRSLTADETPKINENTDSVEFSKLFLGKLKDESLENEAKKVSQIETEKSARSDKQIILEASFDFKNDSTGIVTDTWKNTVTSKGGEVSRKSYNLSFLFNKK